MNKNALLTTVMAILLTNFSQAQRADWVKTIGSNNDEIYELVEFDNYGNMYVAGEFEGTVDFNPHSVISDTRTSNGGKDIFFSKFNSQGVYLWTVTIGGTEDDNIHDMDVDVDGGGNNGIYIAGGFQGTVDFDPSSTGTAEYTSMDGFDPFGARYTVGGVYLSAYVFPGNGNGNVTQIETSGINQVVMAGSFFGDIDFIDGTGGYETSNGMGDIFLTSIFYTGVNYFYHTMGSTSNEQVTCMEIGDDSKILLGGFYSGGFDFDPGASSSYISCSGNSDAFVSVFTWTGNLEWVDTYGSAEYEQAEYMHSVNGEIISAIGFDNELSFIAGYAGGMPIYKTYTAKGYYDVMFTKHDYSGNAQGSSYRHIGGLGYEFVKSIRSNSDNELFVLGTFSGVNFDLDPDDVEESIHHSNGGYDVFYAKYSSNLELEWVETFGGTYSENALDFELKDEEYMLISGQFKNTVDFNPWGEPLTKVAVGNADAFLMEAKSLNNENEIIYMAIPGQIGTSAINPTERTIGAIVPYGTNVTGITPIPTISEGATMNPEYGTPVDFTNPVVFTIIAENQIDSSEWTATVEIALNTATDIETFEFTEQAIPAIIDNINHTVEIDVLYGTDVTGLSPTIGLSYGATSNPESGISQDFTSPVTYVVTAEDGMNTENWTVTVSEALNTATDILSFEITEQTNPAIIDDVAHTIDIEVAYGTDLNNLSPTFSLSTGATSDPASGLAQNFTIPVNYTVTAQDGTTSQDWIVTVTEALNTETDILSFELSEQNSAAIIDNTSHTIDIEVVWGTNLSNLAPTFTLSEGASSNPASGELQDFTDPITYTVTAEDGTTIQEWLVTVTEYIGIAETSSNHLKIYPNPVENLLYLNLIIEESFEKLVIYSIAGNKAMESHSFNKAINLSNLEQGIYILELTTIERTIRKKFIKQ